MGNRKEWMQMTKSSAKRLNISNRLTAALLNDGEMSKVLYEFELVEHIDYWYAGLIEDREDYVFIVTHNRGDVAMLLIDRDKNLYINEDGRTKLAELWQKNYQNNIKRLIPAMADELANDIFAVTGVKVMGK